MRRGYLFETPREPRWTASRDEPGFSPRLRWTLLGFGVAVVGALAVAQFATEAGALGRYLAHRSAAFVGLVSLFLSVFVVFLGWRLVGEYLFRPMRDLMEYRTEIHNWLAIVGMAFALYHGVAYVALGDLRGQITGWIAEACFVGLFITGWWRVWWIYGWGRTRWRIVHWTLASLLISFAAVHWWFAWQDPAPAWGAPPP